MNYIIDLKRSILVGEGRPLFRAHTHINLFYNKNNIKYPNKSTFMPKQTTCAFYFRKL